MGCEMGYGMGYGLFEMPDTRQVVIYLVGKEVVGARGKERIWISDV